MDSIPDFDDQELILVRQILKKRYHSDIEIELADSELRLEPTAPRLTFCPTVYWRADTVHFVIFKTAAQRYRCQFFYNSVEQYGTGIYEYEDLHHCMMTLLQVQADHALNQR